MYSDLYTKLSVDERKVLEDYHKKLASAKGNKSSPQLPPQTTKSRSESKGKSLSKQNSSKVFKNKAEVRKTPSKSASSTNKSFTKRDEDEGCNVKYEVEKLLRALYRHMVICPEFKQELRDFGGISLLDEYLKYKELKTLD